MNNKASLIINSIRIAAASTLVASVVFQGALQLQAWKTDAGFDNQILYAVDTTDQQTMEEKLELANSFLEDNGVTNETGNSCLFFTNNPYCEIGEWKRDRLEATILQLQESEELEAFDLDKIKDNLTEMRPNLTGDGNHLAVEAPNNLFYVYWAGGNIILAHILNLLGWVSLIGFFASIVVLFMSIPS